MVGLPPIVPVFASKTDNTTLVDVNVSASIGEQCMFAFAVQRADPSAAAYCYGDLVTLLMRMEIFASLNATVHRL